MRLSKQVKFCKEIADEIVMRGKHLDGDCWCGCSRKMRKKKSGKKKMERIKTKFSFYTSHDLHCNQVTLQWKQISKFSPQIPSWKCMHM